VLLYWEFRNIRGLTKTMKKSRPKTIFYAQKC